MHEYADALAIVRRADRCQWDLGDYLIQKFGVPHNTQAKDGSGARFEALAEYLQEQGHSRYDPAYLGDLRAVAHAFKKDDRVPSLGFSLHSSAQNPKTLGWIITKAKEDGVDVTRKYIREKMRERRNAAHLAAMAAADKAEEQAAEESDPKKKAALEGRARDQRDKAKKTKPKPAPQRDPSKKTTREPTLAEIKLDFEVQVGEAAAHIRRADKLIAPHIDELSGVFIRSNVEELLALADLVRKLVDKIQRNQTNKRGHLQVMPGGRVA